MIIDSAITGIGKKCNFNRIKYGQDRTELSMDAYISCLFTFLDIAGRRNGNVLSKPPPPPPPPKKNDK